MTGKRPPASRKDPRKTRVRPRPAAFQERATNSHGIEIVQIFGIHAVKAALFNRARPVTSLEMTENALKRLADAVSERKITPQMTTPKALEKRLGSDTVHQGVLLETQALNEPSLEELAIASQTRGPIVALDQLTDPHNVGAILRSAAVFGAAGLVMTRRHSPALSGVLAKSASGALEHVPVHLAGNLATALRTFKQQGLTVVGLDGRADTPIEEVDLKGPIVLVLGAEGKGLRQLTRQTCSMLARIETLGSLTSLNVSNAAAVSLHLAAFARRGKS